MSFDEVSKALRGERVLVTGGAGFIGSHLVEGLASLGARVVVLDSFETGDLARLAPWADEIELISGDIRDIEVCRQACRGARFVLHQAAIGSVPRSIEFPEETVAVNVTGTANIFSAAREAGVERVVYASSSAVYGDSAASVQREGEEGAPLSPYALSKLMNESLAEIYRRCYGMSLIGLRYFNVYGARQSAQGPYAAVIPLFIERCLAGLSPIILGDGEQTRDFIYVKDVVELNLRALVNQEVRAGVFNLGAGTRLALKQLAQTIIELTGFNGEVEHREARAGDILHSSADISELRRAYAWEPRTPLAEGLEAAIAQGDGSASS